MELEEEDDDRVRADPVKGKVGERDLSADAEEEVIAERERDPEEQLAVHIVVVVAHEERRAREHDERPCPPDKGGGAKRQGVFALHTLAFSSPVGRKSKNTMRSTSGTPCAYPAGTGA